MHLYGVCVKADDPGTVSLHCCFLLCQNTLLGGVVNGEEPSAKEKKPGRPGRAWVGTRGFVCVPDPSLEGLQPGRSRAQPLGPSPQRSVQAAARRGPGAGTALTSSSVLAGVRAAQGALHRAASPSWKAGWGWGMTHRGQACGTVSSSCVAELSRFLPNNRGTARAREDPGTWEEVLMAAVSNPLTANACGSRGMANVSTVPRPAPWPAPTLLLCLNNNITHPLAH